MRNLRVITLIALSALGLLFACNARAKADTADDIFILVLDQYSVPYNNRDQAVEEGRDACAVLDQTDNLVAAGENVMAHDPNLSLIQTAHLVGAAVGSYCPQHNNLYTSTPTQES